MRVLTIAERPYLVELLRRAHAAADPEFLIHSDLAALCDSGRSTTAGIDGQWRCISAACPVVPYHDHKSNVSGHDPDDG